MSDETRVLILCTGNSARSQMAEGLLRHDHGERFEVESAGTNPGFDRPEAITVMREVGIDLSGHRSKHVEEFGAQQFDYVITVCDNARKLARCTLARRKNCITILRTLRPLPAPKNKGSL